MLQKKNMRERIWYLFKKNIWQRPTPEVDIQLLFVRLGTGRGTFASGQGTAGGEGEGGPARGCGWILLRGWTKDALNLTKSGCKVALNLH